MYKKKLASLGLSAAVATSMIATPVAGIYADTDNNNASAPQSGNENISESNSLQSNSILDAEEKYDKALKQYDEAEKAYNKAKEDAKKATGTYNSISKYDDAVKASEAEVAEASKALEDAKTEQAKDKKAHEDAKSATKKAKDEYDKIVNDNPEAVELLKESKENLENAEAELKEKQSNLKDGNEKVEAAKNTKADKEASAKKAKENVDSANARVTDKETAKEKAEQKLKEAQEKLDNLLKDDAGYADAKAKVDAAQEKLNNIEKELKDAETEYNAAKENVAEKEKSYKDLQGQLDSLNEKGLRLENLLKEAKDKVDEITQSLEEAIEEKDKLIDKKEESEAALHNAEAELETAKNNAGKANAKLNEANTAVDNAKNALKDADSNFAERKSRGTLGLIEWLLETKGSELTEDQKYDLMRAKTLIENALNENVSSWAPDLKTWGDKKDNPPKPMTGLEATKEKTAALDYENDAISYKNFKESLAFLDETEKYINSSTDPYRNAYVRYLKETNPELLANGGVAYTSFTAIVGAQINSDRDGFYLSHNPVWTTEGGHREILSSTDYAEYALFSPGAGWIDSERIYYDQAAKELGITDLEILSIADLNKIKDRASSIAAAKYDSTGHYEFFLYSNSNTVMGFGRTQKDSSESFAFFKTNSVGQYNSSGKAKYTFAEMKSIFAEYENSFSKKTLEDELKKAQDAQTIAKRDSDTAEAAVNDAQEKLNKAILAKSKVAKVLSDQEALIKVKEEEKNKAEADKKTAEDNLAKFNQEHENMLAKLNEAKELADKAKEEADAEKNKYDDKATEKQKAEEDLQKAKDALASMSDGLGKAQEEVDQATDALNKAESELAQAKQESEKAKEALDKAEQAVEGAKSDLDQAKQESKKAQEALDKAEQDVKAARAAFDEASKKNQNLTDALKNYENKLAEEEKAKAKADASDAKVTEKEAALEAAKEKKAKADEDLKKAKAANANAGMSSAEAEKLLIEKEKEFKTATKNLEQAKLEVMMLLKLIKGDNEKLTIGIDDDFIVSCNGSLKYFTGITIDGNFIPVDQYTAVSGSTVVTISNTYWNKLKAGTHTFQFNYEYGKSPIGTFTLTAKSGNMVQNNGQQGSAAVKSNSPNTGDPNSFVLLPTGLVLLGSLLAARKLRKKEEL